MRFPFTGHALQGLGSDDYPDDQFEKIDGDKWRHNVWARHTTDGKLIIEVSNDASKVDSSDDRSKGRHGER